MKVSLCDIMLSAALNVAQKDVSELCYVSLLVDLFLRIPTREKSKTARSRFLMFCEYENVFTRIGSERFIYIKRVSEGSGQVYQAAACLDVGEVACEGVYSISVTKDTSGLNAMAPTVRSYGKGHLVISVDYE